MTVTLLMDAEHALLLSCRIACWDAHSHAKFRAVPKTVQIICTVLGTARNLACECASQHAILQLSSSACSASISRVTVIRRGYWLAAAGRPASVRLSCWVWVPRRTVAVTTSPGRCGRSAARKSSGVRTGLPSKAVSTSPGHPDPTAQPDARRPAGGRQPVAAADDCDPADGCGTRTATQLQDCMLGCALAC